MQDNDNLIILGSFFVGGHSQTTFTKFCPSLTLNSDAIPLLLKGKICIPLTCLVLKTGSDKIIQWRGRYSFLLGFIMSKDIRGCILNFGLDCKIQTQKERVSEPVFTTYLPRFVNVVCEHPSNFPNRSNGIAGNALPGVGQHFQHSHNQYTQSRGSDSYRSMDALLHTICVRDLGGICLFVVF
jgi:hypothetical protein